MKDNHLTKIFLNHMKALWENTILKLSTLYYYLFSYMYTCNSPLGFQIYHKNVNQI